MGEIRKSLQGLREARGSKKTGEGLKFYTLGRFSAQRQLKTIKAKTKNCKPWGMGNPSSSCDFQNYHSIIFKCPDFNNDKKIARHTKKQKSMAYSKEK